MYLCLLPNRAPCVMTVSIPSSACPAPGVKCHERWRPASNPSLSSMHTQDKERPRSFSYSSSSSLSRRVGQKANWKTSPLSNKRMVDQQKYFCARVFIYVVNPEEKQQYCHPKYTLWGQLKTMLPPSTAQSKMVPPLNWKRGSFCSGSPSHQNIPSTY